MLDVIKKLSLGTTLALIAISTADVANAFQTFSDRQQWEAALSGSTTTFDFSDVAGNPIPSGTQLPNGLSVNYNETTDGSQGFSGFATETGLSFNRGSQPTTLSLNLGLPSPVEAVGFDLSGSGPFGNDWRVSIPNTDSRSLLIGSGFFGFIADPGISFENFILDCGPLSCVGTANKTVSNISVFSETTSVPEPSLTLALGTFLAAGLLLKSQQKKQKFAK